MIRPADQYVPVPGILSAVDSRRDRTFEADVPYEVDQISAAVAEVIGVAIEVPEPKSYPSDLFMAYG